MGGGTPIRGTSTSRTTRISGSEIRNYRWEQELSSEIKSSRAHFYAAKQDKMRMPMLTTREVSVTTSNNTSRCPGWDFVRRHGCIGAVDKRGKELFRDTLFRAGLTRGSLLKQLAAGCGFAKCIAA